MEDKATWSATVSHPRSATPLYNESCNKNIQLAHKELEKHYREQGEIAEAIYHANRLDWEQGVNEWVKVFNDELKVSNYEQCSNLLEIRKELFVYSNFALGRVSRATGDYFSNLARYGEAQQEYANAIAAYDQVSYGHS